MKCGKCGAVFTEDAGNLWDIGKYYSCQEDRSQLIHELINEKDNKEDGEGDGLMTLDDDDILIPS